MKNLLNKELRLAIHPSTPVFLLLSAMLIIPNYPYYVIFFYTTLGLFFICLTGRENQDVAFTAALPVRKADIVRARILFIVLVELAQFILAIPFAALRQGFSLPGNAVGMDANIAFFGLSFAMMGLTNFIFFTRYYANPNKVGAAFVVTSVFQFLFIAAAETCAHVLPFMRDELDTPDPAFLSQKLAVLAIGALVFAALTLLAVNRSVKSFDALDL